MLLGYLLDKAKTTKPKLFLIGSNDNFTGVSKFNDRIAKFPEPKEVYVFDDIDHFYFGKEIELAQKIDDWIRRTFWKWIVCLNAVIITQTSKKIIVFHKEISSISAMAREYCGNRSSSKKSKINLHS